MLAYLFIYEQTHTFMSRVSHFPPFALMAALRSNSAGLIHLKLEEVFKDSVLRVPYKKDTSKRPQETLRCCIHYLKVRRIEVGSTARKDGRA